VRISENRQKDVLTFEWPPTGQDKAAATDQSLTFKIDPERVTPSDLGVAKRGFLPVG
jgi:hypothetical protein